MAWAMLTTQMKPMSIFALIFEYPPFSGQMIPRYRSRAITTSVKMLALMLKCCMGEGKKEKKKKKRQFVKSRN